MSCRPLCTARCGGAHWIMSCIISVTAGFEQCLRALRFSAPAALMSLSDRNADPFPFPPWFPPLSSPFLPTATSKEGVAAAGGAGAAAGPRVRARSGACATHGAARRNVQAARAREIVGRAAALAKQPIISLLWDMTHSGVESAQAARAEEMMGSSSFFTLFSPSPLLQHPTHKTPSSV